MSDYIKQALALGWSLDECQVINANYYGMRCAHLGADGSEDCPECGYPAAAFKREAETFIRTYAEPIWAVIDTDTGRCYASNLNLNSARRLIQELRDSGLDAYADLAL